MFVNGALSSWGSIDWCAYGPGKFPFTFRQRPGPKNALGKVKFMLPNKHNIYLHDTPSKDKFASDLAGLQPRLHPAVAANRIGLHDHWRRSGLE